MGQNASMQGIRSLDPAQQSPIDSDTPSAIVSAPTTTGASPTRTRTPIAPSVPLPITDIFTMTQAIEKEAVDWPSRIRGRQISSKLGRWWERHQPGGSRYDKMSFTEEVQIKGPSTRAMGKSLLFLIWLAHTSTTTTDVDAIVSLEAGVTSRQIFTFRAFLSSICRYEV